MKSATFLISKFNRLLKETEEEVHKTFKPKWVEDKEVKPFTKKDGTLSKRGLTDEEYEDIIKGLRPKTFHA